MTEFIILLLHIYEGGRVLSPAEFQIRVICQVACPLLLKERPPTASTKQRGEHLVVQAVASRLTALWSHTMPARLKL